jgi:hypothetical protein
MEEVPAVRLNRLFVVGSGCIAALCLTGCQPSSGVPDLAAPDLAVPDLAGPTASDGGGACDAGVALTAGGYDPCANVCRRPGGHVCYKGPGLSGQCAADDGCNTCDCEFGPFACTLVACAVADGGWRTPDGGPAWPYCLGAADCPPGYDCIFDPDPTEPAGRCSNYLH